MKVALVCPTVGQTRRGFERYLTDLFRLIRDDVDVTLFKGGGAAGPGERVVSHVTRTGVLSRICGNRLRYPRYHLEYLSFALALTPHLARGHFDIVHFIDLPLCRLLYFSRRLLRAQFGLLFTNAIWPSKECAPWVDHIHCLTPGSFDEARESGIPENRLTVLPTGVEPEQFETSADRAELRRRYAVSPTAFVVLSIASLNRHHKRIDYLIEEVTKIDGEVLLWMDGSLHPDGDLSLLKLAARRLGDRYRYTHVPSERLGELFKLADVLVSTSVHESFGMAILEAMAVGLPVLAHDSPHFRWLTGSAGHLIDMQTPGNLAAELSRFMCNPDNMRQACDPIAVRRRFEWSGLKGRYLGMYRQLIESNGRRT